MAVVFQDKFLPTQPVMREHFAGDDAALLGSMYEAILRFSALQPVRQQFDLLTSDRVPFEEMASNPMMLRFLELLVRMRQPRRVLEIGTFVGVSAMSMARALPPGGTLTTIERFDHVAAIARQNFARNGFADRIRLIEGDAFEQVPRLDAAEPFDMVFLDGNKERYDEYFRLLAPRLASGGLFVTDDVFFHGDALNAEPRTEKGRGVRRFLEAAAAAADYYKVVLPVSNGLMLMLKA